MKHRGRRLLALAAPYTRWMLLAVLLGFATIGSSIGLMTTSAYLISKAALRPSIADLQVAIVGVRFFGIARGIFRYLERYVSHDVTFRLLTRLRVWFYRTLEPLAPARLVQAQSGDLLARVVADVENLEDLFLRIIAPPVVAVLVAILAAVLLGSFDPGLSLVLVAFMLAAGLGLPLLTRVRSRPLGQRLVHVRAELNATLVEGIQGVADLLAYGGGQRHLARVRAKSRELLDLQARMTRVAGLNSALGGLLMNLATLAVLVVSIPLVSDGKLEGVFLALLIMAVISSFEAVLPMPLAFQALDGSLEAAGRLFEIVGVEPAVVDPPYPAPAPTRYGLSVTDLRFAYGPGQPLALNEISFDLPQGGQLAVVGPSGAGKSTLLGLLLRFWDYQDGHILLDGQELRQMEQEAVRRLVAVVSQRTYLFNDTVRENLRLARPGATEAEIVQAAQQAQIHQFFESLPNGYDTWIGEQGLLLSGGQRQRLAVARAILKDAPILILDEPTANLDALTERQVLGALQALMAGRTSLIATHRLVGLDHADEILVLETGRVVERGRHHDLVQMGGVYRRMWDLQRQTLVLERGEG